MKKSFLMMTAAVSALCLSAAEVQDLSAVAKWSKSKNVKAADKGFTVTGKTMLLLSDYIPVDAAKKYTLSIDAKCVAQADKKACFFVGYQPYTAHKRSIAPWSSFVVKNTATELAAPVKKGDKVIKVKNGAGFVKIAHAVIVFDAKDDLSDLPNTKIVARGVTAIAKKDGFWEISLAKPVNRDFAAGTKIRQHSDSGYLYVINRALVSDAVKNFSGTTNGFTDNGEWNGTKWPKGTAFVRIVILSNWQSSAANVIEYKNFKVTVE